MLLWRVYLLQGPSYSAGAYSGVEREGRFYHDNGRSFMLAPEPSAIAYQESLWADEDGICADGTVVGDRVFEINRGVKFRTGWRHPEHGDFGCNHFNHMVLAAEIARRFYHHSGGAMAAELLLHEHGWRMWKEEQ